MLVFYCSCISFLDLEKVSSYFGEHTARFTTNGICMIHVVVAFEWTKHLTTEGFNQRSNMDFIHKRSPVSSGGVENQGRRSRWRGWKLTAFVLGLTTPAVSGEPNELIWIKRQNMFDRLYCMNSTKYSLWYAKNGTIFCHRLTVNARVYTFLLISITTRYISLREISRSYQTLMKH